MDAASCEKVQGAADRVGLDDSEGGGESENGKMVSSGISEFQVAGGDALEKLVNGS